MRHVVASLLGQQVLKRLVPRVQFRRRLVRDQHNPALLTQNLVQRASQRIQAAGKHHHLFRLTVHRLGIVELQIVLDRMFLIQLYEGELVVVVRQEPQRRHQLVLDLGAAPKLRVAHRHHEVQVAPPAIAEVVDVVSSANDYLIGAVDVGGDLQQVVELRRHAAEHFAVDILDAQRDVAFALHAGQPETGVVLGIVADSLCRCVAADDVFFILHW